MTQILGRSIGLWLCLGALSLAQAEDATPVGKQPTRGKATAQSEAGEPRAKLPADTSGTAAPRAVPAPKKTPGAADRLDLGTATVTGEREQPKVMYIVPWKRSDIGDLSGKPMNSLLDEALAPVDREEFKREVVYYQVVNADAGQKGATPAPSKQGEK